MRVLRQADEQQDIVPGGGVHQLPEQLFRERATGKQLFCQALVLVGEVADLLQGIHTQHPTTKRHSGEDPRPKIYDIPASTVIRSHRASGLRASPRSRR